MGAHFGRCAVRSRMSSRHFCMDPFLLLPIAAKTVEVASSYAFPKALDGILGNQGYAIAVGVARRAGRVLRELRTKEPDLNHDLQRAVRQAHLLAAEELTRVALDKARAEKRALFDDAPALAQIQKAIQAELAALPNSLPETAIDDVDLLVGDDDTAPEERLTGLRERQEKALHDDLTRWLGTATHPPSIQRMLCDGWTIRLRSGEDVKRDWSSLVSIAFMETLKRDERVRAVFDSRILAELKHRPALASISGFDGFQRAFDTVLQPIERIEKRLDELALELAEVKQGLKAIEHLLCNRSLNEGTRSIIREFAERFSPTQETVNNLNELVAMHRENAAAAQREVQQWLARYEELEKELAARKAEDGDEDYEEARRHLDAGDLQGATVALERLDQRDDERAAAFNRKRAHRSGTLARAYELQLEWEKALSAYRKAVTLAPGETELRFRLAFFLNKQRRFGPAISEYRVLAKGVGHGAERALCLNNLGNLYTDTNRHEDAEKAFEEALRIHRKLTEGNPEAFTANVALTLDNLGTLYVATNRYAEAEKAFEEALRIRRKLAEGNPEAYAPNAAWTLNNLGSLYTDTNRHEDAEKAFEEALRIHRKLAEGSPEAFTPDVATTLNNLGELYRATNRLEEAEVQLRESIGLRKRFYHSNPGGLGENFTETHTLLAEVLEARSDCAAALEIVARARRISGAVKCEDRLRKVEEMCGDAR